MKLPLWVTVLPNKLNESIKRYVLLSLTLVILNTGFVVIRQTPVIQRDLAATSIEIIQNFPPDLTLTIAPAGITANKDFPLVAQTPNILKDMPKNLAVIDPKGEVSMLQTYDALMLINNSYIIVGSGDTVQTTPLSDFPPVHIDYAVMQKLSTRILFASQNTYLFTTIAFGLINFFDLFIARALYLLIFSLGLFLVYKNSLNTYSKAFQVACHTILPLLILSAIINAAGLVIPFSAWFIFLHTAVTLFFLSSRP